MRSGDEDQVSSVRNLKIRKTWDIIAAAEKGLLPDKMMINTHPQRWTDRPLSWIKELYSLYIKDRDLKSQP